MLLRSFAEVVHFSKWWETLQANDFPPRRTRIRTAHKSCRLRPEKSWMPRGCLVLLMTGSIVCSTVQSTGLIPATGSLLSWMIGLEELLHVYLVTPHTLRKGNFLLRKFQIQASSPVPLSQGFGIFWVNYLHFTFQKWMPRKLLFFFLSWHQIKRSSSCYVTGIPARLSRLHWGYTATAGRAWTTSSFPKWWWFLLRSWPTTLPRNAWGSSHWIYETSPRLQPYRDPGYPNPS